MKIAVIYAKSLGRLQFQAISNLINGKNQKQNVQRKGGWPEFAGRIYIYSQRNLCMYSVDILKFPKKVTIKMTFFGDNFCFGSTGV